MSEIPEKVAYILKRLRTLEPPPRPKHQWSPPSLHEPPVVQALEVTYPDAPTILASTLLPRHETTVKLTFTNGLVIEAPVSALTVSTPEDRVER